MPRTRRRSARQRRHRPNRHRQRPGEREPCPVPRCRRGKDVVEDRGRSRQRSAGTARPARRRRQHRHGPSQQHHPADSVFCRQRQLHLRAARAERPGNRGARISSAALGARWKLRMSSPAAPPCRPCRRPCQRPWLRSGSCSSAIRTARSRSAWCTRGIALRPPAAVDAEQHEPFPARDVEDASHRTLLHRWRRNADRIRRTASTRPASECGERHVSARK